MIIHVHIRPKSSRGKSLLKSPLETLNVMISNNTPPFLNKKVAKQEIIKFSIIADFS